MGFPSMKANSRLWIIGQYGTFLGEGRIDLLQAIDQYGSISQAAQSMNMSYLKAWKLVKSMNKSAGMPLVIKITGGTGGGGSTLTDEGKKAIRLYKLLNSKCKTFASNELKKILTENNY